MERIFLQVRDLVAVRSAVGAAAPVAEVVPKKPCSQFWLLVSVVKNRSVPFAVPPALVALMR